ncbi:MAG: sigma-54-dependent Fis family transcriptional regulator [Deltaproteobacteria bacterium]|nr:sigma-54-dependent Fis family transcriptional regulator [Nannocystaceae bacterium]
MRKGGKKRSSLAPAWRHCRHVHERVDEEAGFGRVVGASAAMGRLHSLCTKLAGSDLPLVIEGETGTGKELLAEALHEAGARHAAPFVVLDCTALPPNLVESALFGHERGAFTGADEARMGVFEAADGGTLLLDEIGDLGLELQAKLLRALERSEIHRVGSTRRIAIDVRFIAATRRDLAQMVRAGTFRDDLYFRLAVTRIELPPLRARAGDITRLARMFWTQLAPERPIPPTWLAELEQYEWPGNVRELKNAVARYATLGEPWAGARERYPAAAIASPPASHGSAVDNLVDLDLPLPEARRRIVEEFERRYIERALARHGGNVARAADASGVGDRYFRMLRARLRAEATAGQV